MRITIRPVLPSDLPFLFATYLRHCWFSPDNTTTLKRATWSKMQHKRLERVFSEELVLVACLSEDPDTIVGYAFMDGSKPFTYVKLDWRSPSLKIADKLLKEIK